MRCVRNENFFGRRLRLVFEQPDDILGGRAYLVLVFEVVGWKQSQDLRQMVSDGLCCAVDGGREGM